jgi:hypothetical protein
VITRRGVIGLLTAMTLVPGLVGSCTAAGVVSDTNTTSAAAVNTTISSASAANPDPIITGASFVLRAGVPAGGGYIEANPPSADGRYPAGVVVTLRAVTDQDHAFNNWGGDAAGVRETVTVVMDADKNITAYFIPM